VRSKRTTNDRQEGDGKVGDAQLAKLIGEDLIACAILDWLSEDGLVLDYELQVERTGEAWLTCKLPYSTVEMHSVLGPIEVATDMALRLLGEHLAVAS
jgi:hypothetical protein